MPANIRFAGFLLGECNDYEIELLKTKEFEMKRLEDIRDIFLFNCYTGLAYIDFYNLTPDNASLGMDGEKMGFYSPPKK
ncbi:MAG: hypothetical protein H7Z13_03985 [Ferruginibacter sp.]|nr:hypothetical protein [Ferruginibacter sp.]